MILYVFLNSKDLILGYHAIVWLIPTFLLSYCIILSRACSISNYNSKFLRQYYHVIQSIISQNTPLKYNFLLAIDGF